jgi:hypothetical protein
VDEEDKRQSTFAEASVDEERQKTKVGELQTFFSSRGAIYL